MYRSIIISVILFSALAVYSFSDRDEPSFVLDCTAPYVPSEVLYSDFGVNRPFEVEFQCEPSNYQLIIKDENGKLVFKSNNPDEVWKGYNSAAIREDGFYQYTLNFDWDTVHVDMDGEVELREIEYSECMDFLYLPTVYTPNGDGINESIYIHWPCPPEEMEVMFFNRWGELLYESTDPYFHWDMTYNSVPLNEGIYVGKVVYTFEGQRNEKVWHITLLR